MVKWLLSLLVIFSFNLVAKENATLKIAAFDWCPAICPNQVNPGYVVEIVQEAFKDSQLKLKFNYTPWVRAIYNTRTGASHALLAPAKNEAPQLIYPKHEVGIQKTCFYTKPEDTWRYKNQESFLQEKIPRKVAAVLGNSLVELDEFAKKNPRFFTYHNSDNFLDRATRMMKLGRINTFVYTDFEASYYFNKNKIMPFRNAGCVDTVMLYIAFSPKNKILTKKYIDTFDQGMERVLKTDFIEKTLKKYGLEPWK